MISDPLEVLALVGRPLADSGLRWLVGGSVASSFHGVPRSTLDVDLVVEFPESAVDQLVSKWSQRFLVDSEMILDAIRRGASCNLIHLDSALKVDLFLGVDDPWIRQELQHPDLVPMRIGDSELVVPFARAEDVLLHKLRWFLDGGSQSDRQWGDVLGIVRARGEDLDRAHMERWAVHLGIPQTLIESALRRDDRPIGTHP